MTGGKCYYITYNKFIRLLIIMMQGKMFHVQDIIIIMFNSSPDNKKAFLAAVLGFHFIF
jgi:hypothetical protein